MNKIGTVALTLGLAVTCAAQPSLNNEPSAQTPSKQFRLTFMLTYPEGHHAMQSLVLEVPVGRDQPGIAKMTLSSGSMGQVEGSVAESLQCSDVHETATGLAAEVTFTMDRITPDGIGHSGEPLHHQLTFERKVDLVPGKETRITEPMHRVPLRAGDPVLPDTVSGPPQISVLVVAL